MTTRISFEQFVAQHNGSLRPGDRRPDPERCEMCGRQAGRNVRFLGDDGTCEACMRYLFGCEETENAVAEALLGGVVRSALELDPRISPERIVAIVQAAIQEVLQEDFEDEKRWLRQHRISREEAVA